jgi:hypothetical protein
MGTALLWHAGIHKHSVLSMQLVGFYTDRDSLLLGRWQVKVSIGRESGSSTALVLILLPPCLVLMQRELQFASPLALP